LAIQEIKNDAMIRQVGFEVVQAVEEANFAQRQTTTLRSAVDQAHELIRLTNLQYREGDINFVTYLEHLAAVRETKLTYIRALADYRSQLALLDRAVAATLVPTDIEEEIK